MTGFTVLGAKMSSLKNREMDIIFGKKCQFKKKKVDYKTDSIKHVH